MALKMLLMIICLAATADAVAVGVGCSPLEISLYSGIISFIGGIAAASRQKGDATVQRHVSYGINTMILGSSISLMGYPFVYNRPQYMFAFIGLSGGLSLGGLVTVDWAVNLLKKTVETKVETKGKDDGV